MIDFNVSVDASSQKNIERVIKQVQDSGDDRRAMLADIATLGENSTRERFATETAPDGTKWKPSLRQIIHGGKTLTLDGHLGDSLNKHSDDTMAEWGVNRVYAAIHQFGGVIKAKTSKGLRFRAPGGGYVTKKQVTMPARPYLGINAQDEAEILDIAAQRVKGMFS